jgi:hypothetical protein
VNGVIDHLYTRLGTVRNYRAIAELHALKIIRAHAKSSRSAFTSRFLVTDLNNGDSSAYVLTSLPTVYYSTMSTQLIESQSYCTTGGLPPISSSWRQAPWVPRPVFFLHLNTCGYSSYVTSSLTRGWVCRLQLLLVLASAVIFRAQSRGIHDHILLPQIRDSPNLKGQVPVFISPRNRVAQLYLSGTGFPFRRLLRLTGLRWRYSNPLPTVQPITSRHGPHRKHRSSIFTWVFVAAGTCLLSRCLETVAVYSPYLAVVV